MPRYLDTKSPSEDELSFGQLDIPSDGSIPFKVNIAKR